jgi:hypothetical protein
MSSTVRAPYIELGKGGDYPVEMNYAVRIYDNLGEKIPNVGEYGASLKGGQRTNFIGEVPLLDGSKEPVGKAEIVRIVSAKPENILESEVQQCGFKNIEEAIEYVAREHKEEFERDGVMTVFTYKVTERK